MGCGNSSVAALQPTPVSGAPAPPNSNDPTRLGVFTGAASARSQSVSSNNPPGPAPMPILKKVEPGGPDEAVRKQSTITSARKKSVMFEADLRTIVTDSGTTYRGLLSNGMRNGYGVLSAPDGEKYEGDWKDDLQHGVGVWTGKNGDRYEGSFVGGKREGKGTLLCTDGTEYTGMWAQDTKNGEGSLKENITAADGSSHLCTYTGNFVNDLRDGTGVSIMDGPHGHKYEGQWWQGCREGQGTQTWNATGDVYTGLWSRDQMHGRGKFTSKHDGSVFEGEFMNGQRLKGTLTLSNGDVYVGDFQNGVFHGQGQMTYASGPIKQYAGAFRDGKPHGRGQQTLRSVSGAQPQIVTGEWQNGTFVGPSPPGLSSASLANNSTLGLQGTPSSSGLSSTGNGPNSSTIAKT